MNDDLDLDVQLIREELALAGRMVDYTDEIHRRFVFSGDTLFVSENLCDMVAAKLSLTCPTCRAAVHFPCDSKTIAACCDINVAIRCPRCRSAMLLVLCTKRLSERPQTSQGYRVSWVTWARKGP